MVTPTEPSPTTVAPDSQTSPLPVPENGRKAKWICSLEPFFSRNLKLPEEVVEGAMREGQIAALAADYHIGKSPLLQDLMLCRVHGLRWCGRQVKSGPVVYFDAENPGAVFKANIKGIAARYGVMPPLVPSQLVAFLTLDQGSYTDEVASALERGSDGTFELLEGQLQAKPNALVVFDPVDLFFPNHNMIQKRETIKFVNRLRALLAHYPKALLVLVFNLRKEKGAPRPSLLSDPHGWLQEISATNDIVSRVDVRLGLVKWGDDDQTRLLHGVRRGRDEMYPTYVRPVGDTPESLAGFETIPPIEVGLHQLSAAERSHWNKLPPAFTFTEAAAFVPKSSLSKLVNKTRAAGLLGSDGRVFKKLI